MPSINGRPRVTLARSETGRFADLPAIAKTMVHNSAFPAILPLPIILPPRTSRTSARSNHDGLPPVLAQTHRCRRRAAPEASEHIHTTVLAATVDFPRSVRFWVGRTVQLASYPIAAKAGIWRFLSFENGANHGKGQRDPDRLAEGGVPPNGGAYRPLSAFSELGSMLRYEPVDGARAVHRLVRPSPYSRHRSRSHLNLPK